MAISSIGSNGAAAPTVPTQLVIPGAEPGHGLSEKDLADVVRAMLFVAAEPTRVSELAAGASLAPTEIERGLAYLASHGHGLSVQRQHDRVSLVTDPRFARHIRRFLGLDREAKLSSAALEALAIIAYRQPATRSEIESVRGVDCSGVIATLHARGLIEPVSRRTTIGNPIQYGTTGEFLCHFGLASLAELPALGKINGRDGQNVLTSAMEPDYSGDSRPTDGSAPPDTQPCADQSDL